MTSKIGRFSFLANFEIILAYSSFQREGNFQLGVLFKIF